MRLALIFSTTGLLVCLLAGATAPNQVDALIEANHWKQARTLVESRLRANPNDAQAHAWLSKIKIGFNELDGAIAEADRAVAMDPKNATYLGLLAEACAEKADIVNPLKGWTYVRRMKKASDAALAINPNHVDTLLVKMMFSWKAPSIAGGDRKLALRLADQLVGVAPVWGYLGHARLLQDQGPDPETESWLKKAVQADPSFYRARYNLARFYCCTAKTKRLDMAERAANDAIALDPAQEGGYEILARVYAVQQRWADLESILARAGKATPENPGPFFAAAKGLLEIGQDFQRAERYLNHYLSQPPEGRQPSHAEARLVMANLFAKEGRKADAVRQLQAALALQPDFEPAKAELKRLRNS